MPSYSSTNKKVHEKIQSIFKDGKERGKNERAIVEKMRQTKGIEVDPRTIRNYMGKPAGKASIHPKTLEALCHVLLGCGYEAAIRKYSPETSQNPNDDKYQQYIYHTCGKVSILDMDQPTDLAKLFISPMFLPRPRNRLGYDLVRLLPNRLVPKYPNECLPSDEILANHKHILVTGLPGSGKTMWLKHLALFCLENDLQGQRYFPMYCELPWISPKHQTDFSSSLLPLLSEHLPHTSEVLTEYLEAGKAIILLDSLDRVSQQNLWFILKGINDLVRRYPQNRFIIARRTKSPSTYKFSTFMEVELSGFSKLQIAELATKWFNNSPNLTPEERSCKQQRFMYQLTQYEEVEHLAANPLLATFLLTVAERRNEIVEQKLTLYQRVIRVLVDNWNQQNNIYDLSRIPKSMDQRMYKDVLSLIAYEGLCRHKTELESFHVEDITKSFLSRIGRGEIDPSSVVEELEGLYGVLFEFANGHFTFQHLALQEFLAARYIVQQGDEMLERSIHQYFPDPFFQEVFPLAAERLANCDRMLNIAFNYIQRIIQGSEKLNHYLKWLEETTIRWQKEAASSGWRALLLALDVDLPLYKTRPQNDIEIERSPFHELATNIQKFNKGQNRATRNTVFLNIALWLVIIYSLAQDHIHDLQQSTGQPPQKPTTIPLKESDDYIKDVLEITNETTLAGELTDVIAKAQEINEVELADMLKHYQSILPFEEAPVDEWQNWSENLRQVMIERFGIGHEVAMSESDYRRLHQYAYCSNLLMRCIRDSSTSTFSLRNKLVDQMLLPYIERESTPQNSPLLPQLKC